MKELLNVIWAEQALILAFSFEIYCKGIESLPQTLISESLYLYNPML